MKRRMLLLAAVAGLIGAGCSRFGMPVPGTEQADETLGLWKIFFVAAIVVAAIVYGLIVWSLIHYRRRRSDPPDAVGSQFRENFPLEIVYTAIPVVIVVVLFALSVRAEGVVSRVDPNPDQIVRVEAFTWGWRFTYPNGVAVESDPSGPGVKGPEMVLPRGQTTRIVLTSSDVIHSFWVPGFFYKHDAIPGRTFEFDFTPTRNGTFDGECAEFCGFNHAFMTFSVRVVDPSEFDAWLAEQPAGASPPPIPAVSPIPGEEVPSP